MNQNSAVIAQCLGNLQAAGNVSLLIPQTIRLLKARFPSMVVCNDITEELATALMANDVFVVEQLRYFGGVLNNTLLDFLRQIPKGETVLVHYYKDGQYHTQAVEFMYEFNRSVVCANHFWVDCNNVIAVARIPQQCVIPSRYMHDDHHVAFNALTKRALA